MSYKSVGQEGNRKKKKKESSPQKTRINWSPGEEPCLKAFLPPGEGAFTVITTNLGYKRKIPEKEKKKRERTTTRTRPKKPSRNGLTVWCAGAMLTQFVRRPKIAIGRRKPGW